MPSAGHDRFLLQFAPDAWLPAMRFIKFVGPPFLSSKSVHGAIKSCIDHSRKYEILASLANRIQPTLIEDIQQLELNGYTPGARSSEFAAVIEVMVCELYSILDGIRYSLFWMFPNCRGVQQNSTSRLFSRAKSGSYGSEFPEYVRVVLAAANDDWFPELRRLRTAFTHGGLGSCHLDKQTELVAYMNPSLGNAATAHVVPDIVSLVTNLAVAVFGLQKAIFDYLYAQLLPNASYQFCGIYKGRMYRRSVVPTADLNRGSGICDSRDWFETEAEYSCPLASDCPAYARVAS